MYILYISHDVKFLLHVKNDPNINMEKVSLAYGKHTNDVWDLSLSQPSLWLWCLESIYSRFFVNLETNATECQENLKCFFFTVSCQ